MTAAADPATAGTLGEGGSGRSGPRLSDPGGLPNRELLVWRLYAESFKSVAEIRYRLGYPCGTRHPVNGRLCDKPVGHWRFRDGRRYHRSNEPHVEPLRSVYPATWVHVWR